MNEINIILDSDLELNDNLSTLKNDKKILFEKVNKHMNILNINKNSYASDELINSKLDDLLYLDNYIDFITDIDLTSLNTTNNFENDVINKLENKSSFSKKIIIKKMLELIHPIIEDSNINNVDINKKSTIVNKSQIMLNYPIESKYINPKLHIKELKTYIIPALNYFNVVGLYNNENLSFNLPYTLNEFNLEINSILKRTQGENNLVYIKDLSYNNKCIFSIENINIEELIKLYKLVLARFKLHINNFEIDYNKKEINESYKSNITDNDEILNEDLVLYNKFLNSKIGNYLKDNNTSINNIYNSFNNDGLLFLYEKIKLYTIDNDNVKNIINKIVDQKKNLLEYNKNKLILNNKILVNNKLEHSTKKKFPNLFNPNHKENIFNKFNLFDINKLPKKYKEVILLDFKKNEDFIKNQLYNKCKHKEILKNFYNSDNKYSYFQDLLKFINKDTNTSKNNNIYKCSACSFNLICPHVVDYYILLFSKNTSKNNTLEHINNNADYINQKIINKYMSNAPIDMIYYCKVCGEMLGTNAEIEQNSEYKDNIKTNTLEYSDTTSTTVMNSVSYIVYTYVSFKGITMSINKKQIIKYIIDNISIYINNIEKKLRKGKNYDNEKITHMLKFNIIIFTYASIIFIMNKYPNLVFHKVKQSNKFDNIIVAKEGSNYKKGSKSMNNIKENFRSAYELIINTNYLLLSKLDYNKSSDVVKNILVKTYTLINNSNELELDMKKILI